MSIHLRTTQLASLFQSRQPSNGAQYTHLRLDQYQVNEEHHEVMLDVFVREQLAARALREAHALAQRPVVRLAVRRVQRLDRIAALYADDHCQRRVGGDEVALMSPIWTFTVRGRGDVNVWEEARSLKVEDSRALSCWWWGQELFIRALCVSPNHFSLGSYRVMQGTAQYTGKQEISGIFQI